MPPVQGDMSISDVTCRDMVILDASSFADGGDWLLNYQGTPMGSRCVIYSI